MSARAASPRSRRPRGIAMAMALLAALAGGACGDRGARPADPARAAREPLPPGGMLSAAQGLPVPVRTIVELHDGSLAVASDGALAICSVDGIGLHMPADRFLALLPGGERLLTARRAEITAERPSGLHVRTDLTTNTIDGMCADRDGALWIGSAHGLLRYRDGDLVGMHIAAWDRGPADGRRPWSADDVALADGHGSRPVALSDGTIAVGGGPGVIAIIHPQRGLVAAHVLWPLEHLRAQVLPIAADGDALLVYADRGITRIRHGRQERLGAFDADRLGPTMLLATTSDGTRWASTWEGLLRCPRGARAALLRDPQAPAGTVAALSAASDGSLWVATDGGIARWDGLAWQHCATMRPDVGAVTCIVHAQARLWIGGTRGLARDPAMTWTSTPPHARRLAEARSSAERSWPEPPPGLPAALDAAGRLALRIDGTVQVFDGRTWADGDNDLLSRWSETLLPIGTTPGHAWRGSVTGCLAIAGEDGRPRPLASETPSIAGWAESPDGTLWAHDRQQLWRLGRSDVVPRRIAGSLPIAHLAADGKGRPWAISDRGQLHRLVDATGSDEAGFPADGRSFWRPVDGALMGWRVVSIAAMGSGVAITAQRELPWATPLRRFHCDATGAITRLP